MRGSPASAHAAAAPAATVSWNAAAISARGRPADELRRDTRPPGSGRVAEAPRIRLCRRRRRRAARARSPPGPRSSPCSRTPSSAATASKSRPIPDESGGSSFRLSRTTCQRSHGTGNPARSRCSGSEAPGLPDRRLAAGKRHRLEVGEPLEALEVAAQQLAAPERPVGAVARPVEDERERRPLLAVLGETRRGVGVVVLDADELRVLLERPLRRQVLGMEVVRDDLGLDRRASRGTSSRSERNAR